MIDWFLKYLERFEVFRNWLNWLSENKGKFVVFLLVVYPVAFIIFPKFHAFLYQRIDLSLVAPLWQAFFRASQTDWAALFVFVVCLAVVMVVLWERFYVSKNKRTVRLDPEESFNYWSRVKTTKWSLVTDKDSSRKVFKVGLGLFPGVLKWGTDWINYELAFDVKLEANKKRRPAFTFIVRAEDKANGVLFSIFCDGRVEKNYLYAATLIEDNEVNPAFPVEITPEKWVSVKVRVVDDEVTISFLGISKRYKLKTGFVNVDENAYRTTAKIPILDASDNNGEAAKPANAKRLFFEYERGTVGFGGNNSYEFLKSEEISTAYYKNISVRPLPPFVG